ncbi:MAG: hypothetical protein ABI868_10650, partial [Acidobacteriota bacterium]
MGSLSRMLAVVFLVPWLAVSAVIAREHVHESVSADHVAHSHFAPHTRTDHDALQLDHDGAEVSDADVDEDVVWMNDVALVQAPRSFPPLLVVVAAPLAIVPERFEPIIVVADQ